MKKRWKTFTFSMYEKAKVQPQKIPGLLEQFKGDLAFKADAENPCFLYEKKSRNKKEKNTDVLAVVKNVLIGIKGLIDQ